MEMRRLQIVTRMIGYIRIWTNTKCINMISLMVILIHTHKYIDVYLLRCIQIVRQHIYLSVSFELVFVSNGVHDQNAYQFIPHISLKSSDPINCTFTAIYFIFYLASPVRNLRKLLPQTKIKPPGYQSNTIRSIPCPVQQDAGIISIGLEWLALIWGVFE